ncbi:MAG: sulfite exporter TauE/SafE family protein [Anaerolineales bacterium]|nr:sulfite exporter TauE/SafE family protein [Anaerolineales bacterium]
MSALFVPIVVFLAVLTQSLAGFGSAMVAMSLLAGPLGLPVASPLVALTAVVLEIAVLARHRQALNLAAVWRLMLGTLAAVPVGVLAVRLVPEAGLLALLGGLLSAYAGYGLLGRRPPELRHPAWGFLAGALAGLLGGAYNVGGPPAIVYGDCRRWPPAEFKSNLQSLFLVNDLLVLALHALAGNLNAAVWAQFWPALPALGLALAAGFALERRVPPAAFRRLALGLLLVLGARLLWSAWAA